MIIYTHRNPRAFERSYGFSLVETEIIDEKKRHKMSRSL